MLFMIDESALTGATTQNWWQMLGHLFSSPARQTLLEGSSGWQFYPAAIVELTTFKCVVCVEANTRPGQASE